MIPKKLQNMKAAFRVRLSYFQLAHQKSMKTVNHTGT